MPSGILTVMVRRLLTTPAPWQLLQGESIICPLPLHTGQGTTCTNIVKPPFLMFWTFPAPLHLVQVFGDVPGLAPDPLHTSHFSVLGNCISFSVPLAASSSV